MVEYSQLKLQLLLAKENLSNMDNKAKFLVRFTIIVVSLYFMTTYILAQFFGILFFNDFYVTLLELCLCVFCTVQGSYHCKYIRYTSYGIFTSDTITRIDNQINFMTIDTHNLIPAFILFSCILLSSYLAVRHFIKTIRLNKQKRKIEYELRPRNERQD